MVKKDEDKQGADKLDQILQELKDVRADIKAMKMNILQINQLKVRMGERV